MLPQLAIIFFMVTSFFLSTACLTLNSIAEENERLVRVYDQKIVTKRVYSQVKDSSFPATTSDFVSLAGNEDLREILDSPYVGYARSGMLNDSVWQFRRILTYAQDTDLYITKSDYLSNSNNSENDGPFSSALKWGSSSGVWSVVESKNYILKNIQHVKSGLDITMGKMGRYYSAKAYFPRERSDGTILSAGTTDTLANIVGYSGPASTCSGIYSFDGIPIGSEDMFTLTGEYVRYTYISPNHVAVTANVDSKNNILTASGDAVITGSHINLD